MRSANGASRSMISKPSSIPSPARFLRIACTARFDDSTKYTMRASRLNASIPIAPVPAKRSSQTDPATRGATTLNSVSRSRSDVGRIWDPAGTASRRLLYLPAITRICDLPSPIEHPIKCIESVELASDCGFGFRFLFLVLLLILIFAKGQEPRACKLASTQLEYSGFAFGFGQGHKSNGQ